MDFNFPELLARDLASANSAFMSREMTAGVPSPALAGETSRRGSSSLLNPLRNISPSRSESHYLSSQQREHSSQKMLSKAKSMGTAGESRYGATMSSLRGQYRLEVPQVPQMPEEESSKPVRGPSHRRQPAVSQPKYASHSSDDNTSDSSFFDDMMEPPPARGRAREQSVTTAATSVISGGERCASAQSHKADDHDGPRASWLDFGAGNPHCAGNRVSWGTEDSFIGKRPQTSTGPASSQEHKQAASLASAIDVPIRRSSLSHRVTMSPGGSVYSEEPSMTMTSSPINIAKRFAEMPPMQSPTTRFFDYNRDTSLPSSPALLSPATAFAPRPRNPTPNSGLHSREDGDDYAENHHNHRPPSRKSHIYHTRETTPDSPGSPGPEIRNPPTPPRLQSSNIQTWLDSSVDMAMKPQIAPPCREPISTVGVPLPRNVIDNLQISINHFPETMLTTHTLTIETIRAYARKMRRPPAPWADEERVSPTTRSGKPASNKKWTLSRLLPSKTTSGLGVPYGHALPPSPVSSPHQYDSPSPQHCEDTAHIRAIFPGASEYLCDALYAHLVAYNYIANLMPTSSPCAFTRPASPEVQQIPNKAAMLLGIPSSGQSIVYEGGQDNGSTTTLGESWPPAPKRSEPEAWVKALHQGLADCIGKLVSTIKVTTEQNANTSFDAPAPKEIDPMLMRALCEMVKCAEEVR